MSLEMNRCVKKPENVLVQNLDDEAVLLNLGNGQYYGLDSVGFRMYQQLISSSNIETAYQSMLAEYDVDPVQLETDLDNLLQKLLRNGLVSYS